MYLIGVFIILSPIMGIVYKDIFYEYHDKFFLQEDRRLFKVLEEVYVLGIKEVLFIIIAFINPLFWVIYIIAFEFTRVKKQ